MAAISTLTETFDTYDTGKWVKAGTNTANVNTTGGRLQIACTTGADDNQYNSVSTWDLTNSSAYVEVVDPAMAANENETWVQFYITDWQNAISFSFTGYPTIQLKARYTVSASDTVVNTATYNATNHRWLRVRHSSGTIFWEVSADGSTWNSFASAATPITITGLKARLEVDNWATTAAARTAIFDNFNVNNAGVASALIETFDTYDTAKWVKTGTNTANVNITGGQLEIATSTAADENALQSVATWDLTNSSIYVKAVDPGIVANENECWLQLQAGSSANLIGFAIGGFPTTTIQAYKVVASTGASVASATYNSTNHKWWRIRHSGSNVLWDTAPDGTTWTNFATLATPITITALKVRLQADNWGTTTARTAIFDNVNTLGGGGSASGMFFGG